jgi:integration host factor subunit alpha
VSLVKKNIYTNISKEAQIPLSVSKNILNSFLTIIKSHSTKTIKLSNFGVFYYHKSPVRFGRNPKTKELYKISARQKLNFRSSNKVKKIIN